MVDKSRAREFAKTYVPEAGKVPPWLSRQGGLVFAQQLGLQVTVRNLQDGRGGFKPGFIGEVVVFTQQNAPPKWWDIVEIPLYLPTAIGFVDFDPAKFDASKWRSEIRGEIQRASGQFIFAATVRDTDFAPLAGPRDYESPVGTAANPVLVSGPAAGM